MSRTVDLAGMRFGRIIARSKVSLSGRAEWLCDCDCGAQKLILAQSLRSGATQSCGGCIGHGKSRTQEHAIWAGMLARCNNPNVKSYAGYGGRGIKVCDAWLDFPTFLRDVGPRPSKDHSLDRLDTDGDYGPGNVRWATQLEQANNKRTTRHVIYRGERMSLCDAVRAAGSVIHYEAAWVRIKSGWTIAEALETPRTMESPNSKARKAPLREVA